jgi:MYXO-CTERM domain-containing protein
VRPFRRKQPSQAPRIAAATIGLLALLVLVLLVGRRRSRTTEIETELTIDPRRDPAAEVRRVADEQLRVAVSALRSDRPEAIHDARKAIKRLRALLTLLDDGPEKAVRDADRRLLRDCGRRLSAARDAEVIAATLDELLLTAPERLRRAAAPLSRRLDADARERLQHVRTDRSAIEMVIADLEQLRAGLSRWVPPSRRGWQVERLTQSYKGARRAARAAQKDSGSENMHELRKRTQEVRYASSILRASSPKALRRLNRRSTELSETIGLERDLDLLGSAVDSNAPGLSKRAHKELHELIRARRKLFRKGALREARRLYSRPPRRFAQSLVEKADRT